MEKSEFYSDLKEGGALSGRNSRKCYIKKEENVMPENLDKK